MPYREKEKPNKGLIIAAIIIVCFLLAFLGVVMYSVYKQNSTITEVVAVDLTPRIIVPDGHFDSVEVTKSSVNKDVKSLTILPLVDFYKDDSATSDKISKEIDAIITSANKMGFNNIVLGVNRNEQVIYSSSRVETAGMDVLKMFLDKAKENEINVDVLFSLTGYNTIMRTTVDEYISPTNNEAIVLAIDELVRMYDFNSLMLTDYYLENNGSAYSEFIAYSDADLYEDWLLERSEQTFDNIIKKVKTTDPDLAVGIYITDTWANYENNERGSQTFSNFEALFDGYVDTKSLIDNKKVDFVNVLIDTSRVDTSEPFKTVADYWGTLCKQSSIPMYVTHAGENSANSSIAGWNGTDELSRQVAEAVKSGNYYGSSFTGLERLDKNVGGSTDYLVKYLKDEIAEDELYADLTITTPTSKNFTTYEEDIQFRMQFDPNAEVKLNGEAVIPSERGGASVWIPLTVGFNKITLEHKGQIVTYTIERKVIILDSVSPKDSMAVPGGSSIYVNVVAYKDSKITASLNGQTITLTDMGVVGDSGGDSAYRNYQGNFVVPASTAKDVAIGSISFRGEYQGYVETATGSAITVAKLPDEVDPDELTGQVLEHAVVTSTYANTYAYKLPTEYANGIYYQLPRGSEDIVVSRTGEYLNLRSGKTIHSSTATVTSKEFVGNNAITRMDIGVSNNDTVISMDMRWASPFSINLSPYPTQELSTGKIDYQFAANKLVLTLDYVTMIGDDAIVGSISNSPLFSGMTYEKVRNEQLNINQLQFTFTLAQTGKYYGCHSSWNGNTLTLKFNQAPASGSLSGVTVVLDPGHGGTDPGTTAGRDIYEKDAALLQANAIRDALQAKGATVLMTRTSDTTLSLSQRTAFAHSNQADIFLSVHYNSSGSNSTPNGPQMYFNAPFSQPLAQAMQTQVNQITPDNGWSYWQFQNFFVAREKQFPSVLIEVGFLSNLSDESKALDASYRASFAEKIAQGVVNYYS